MPALRRFRSFAVIAALSLPVLGLIAATPAEAHTFGAWGAGFTQGFLHPLLGHDHELAMIGVGFWAGQTGGRTNWLVPLSFVLMMIVGGGLGLTGFMLPGLELGIGASILLLGILIGLRSRLPLPLSMGSVAAFAIFHGIAHGAEAPEAAAPTLYCLGFILATALLHATGIGLSKLMARAQARDLLLRRSDQVIGIITAMLGLGLVLDLWAA